MCSRVDQGQPVPQLFALRTGNLTVIRAAAAELPTVNLEDALSICLLVAKQRDVAEAFARLRDDGEGAAAALRRLSR